MKKLVLGGLVAATTAALSVPVLGLAGSPSATAPVPFRAPVAAADEALPVFEDCEALLDWYVEEALPLVGPWGFGHPYLLHGFAARDLMMFSDNSGGMAEDSATNQRAASPTDASKSVGNSETGTNVQEQGVDEPDHAKTDGEIVVRIFDRELIVTDISGDEAEELSRTRLPKRFWGEDLLLVGDTVVVTGQSRSGYQEPYYSDLIGSRIAHGYGYGGNAELLVYSLEDRERPELESRHEFEGSLVEARQYDETLRVVIRSGLPPLDFVEPNRRRTEKEATQENRDLVRASVIEDWIPGVRDGSAEDAEAGRTPLFDCADVRHPRDSSGFGTLSVVTFGIEDPTDRSVTAVTTSGDLAYSSLDRLYVATPVQRRLPVDDGWWSRGRRALPEPPATTEVHSFALTPDGTSYVASGTVRGTIRDRWSMDEYDGDLRVATALGREWDPLDNGVTVLRESGDDLEVRGSVRGLGPREDIKSVRWFDDLAIVVTFRQVDPLYTVDLSDPDDPRVLGELKIPGFSSYLHPVGEDQLLGLGTAATMSGRVQGAQVATFDISDLKEPGQISVLRLEREDELVAGYDPRAFTFVGGRATRTAYTTVSSWNGRTRVISLLLAEDGTLSQGEEWPARHSTRILPIDGDRVAFVGKVVRIVER